MVRLKIYKIEVLLLVIVILDLPESIHPSALLLEVSSCFNRWSSTIQELTLIIKEIIKPMHAIRCNGISRVIVATTKYPCSTRSLSSC